MKKKTKKVEKTVKEDKKKYVLVANDKYVSEANGVDDLMGKIKEEINYNGMEVEDIDVVEVANKFEVSATYRLKKVAV